MSNNAKARVIGMGSYLPEKVLSNQDLEKLVDTSDEWIFSRTGMKERRIARDDEHASTMGAEAGRRALATAGKSADDVDLILVATMTPDYTSPSTAGLVQQMLSAKNAAAMDVQAMCSGYLYALTTAKAYIESGLYRCVLVVASEKMSSVVDYTDRNTCILFGDGASASVVTGEGAGLQVDTVSLGSDGSLAELIWIPGGGSRCPPSAEMLESGKHYFQMSGREVYKHAVRRMASTAQTCLDTAGVTADQISWVVPHQANLRIMEAITKSFVIPSERVYKTVHKYGNTSASGVAIALDDLTREHALSAGERVLLIAFGGGLTWGAMVLKQVEG